jgi:hypothetical protein
MIDRASQPPRRDWPQIGDIIPNHDGYRPPPTAELAGQFYSFALSDGTTVDLSFETARILVWREGGTGQARHQPHEAFRIRENCYFVDFVDVGDARQSISFVLNTAEQTIFLVRAGFPAAAPPQADMLSRVAATDSQSLGRAIYKTGSSAGAAPQAKRTDALLGKYIRYTYSDTHTYDHYYISDRYYLWYCWQGPDAGLGDFDEIDYFDLGDELFLICWREKLLPALAVMVEDHRANRSIGKVYGVGSRSWAPGNTTVGATFEVIAGIPAGG